MAAIAFETKKRGKILVVQHEGMLIENHINWLFESGNQLNHVVH